MITKADSLRLQKDFQKVFATKEDLKNFATKKDLRNFATKKDLRNFVTKKDLRNFATKNDLTGFATKTELKELRDLVLTVHAEVMGELKALREEITVFAYRQSDHSQQLENHDQRLNRLES